MCRNLRKSSEENTNNSNTWKSWHVGGNQRICCLMLFICCECANSTLPFQSILIQLTFVCAESFHHGKRCAYAKCQLDANARAHRTQKTHFSCRHNTKYLCLLVFLRRNGSSAHRVRNGNEAETRLRKRRFYFVRLFFTIPISRMTDVYVCVCGISIVLTRSQRTREDLRRRHRHTERMISKI